MALLRQLLLLFSFLLPGCPAFVARPKKHWASSLLGLKNKQADLARKMELAKQQQAEQGIKALGDENNKQTELARKVQLPKQQGEAAEVESSDTTVLGPREDTEAMQRQEFKRLLAQSHIPKESKSLPERDYMYDKRTAPAKTVIPSTLTPPKRRKHKRKTKTAVLPHGPEGTVSRGNSQHKCF